VEKRNKATFRANTYCTSVASFNQAADSHKRRKRDSWWWATSIWILGKHCSSKSARFGLRSKMSIKTRDWRQEQTTTFRSESHSSISLFLRHAIKFKRTAKQIATIVCRGSSARFAWISWGWRRIVENRLQLTWSSLVRLVWIRSEVHLVRQYRFPLIQHTLRQCMK
jgi:hypothetical protein